MTRISKFCMSINDDKLSAIASKFVLFIDSPGLILENCKLCPLMKRTSIRKTIFNKKILLPLLIKNRKLHYSVNSLLHNNTLSSQINYNCRELLTKKLYLLNGLVNRIFFVMVDW